MARAVLCGSVNLATTEDVFRTVASIAGESLARIPDGETGERASWIRWQIPRLAALPELEHVADVDAYGHKAKFRLRDGADPAALQFDLGYADVAAASYATFAALKQDGAIGAATRFQVCLPTPMALGSSYIAPSDHDAVVPVLERALLDELRRIADAIPHEELAIQWDVAAEMALIEGVGRTRHADDPSALLDQVARMGDAVPGGVELGLHLCYGDAPGDDGLGHHFMEPADTAKLVLVANGLADRTRRTISWIHMPVPIERDDDPYFAPLFDLAIAPETELYLGLVHHEDGLEGAQRRANAAGERIHGFGVATECGMGRVPQEVVPELLRVHTLVETP